MNVKVKMKLGKQAQEKIIRNGSYEVEGSIDGNYYAISEKRFGFLPYNKEGRMVSRGILHLLTSQIEKIASHRGSKLDISKYLNNLKLNLEIALKRISDELEKLENERGEQLKKDD